MYVDARIDVISGSSCRCGRFSILEYSTDQYLRRKNLTKIYIETQGTVYYCRASDFS